MWFIKGFLTPAILISVIAISCYSFDSEKIKDKKALPESKGFAVIELFTSEGCSSCPPADDLVSKLLKENHQDVYVLSFHVDYWDRLGWKDSFSQSLFTNRQKQYARFLSLESVYTPQIIVNGEAEFVGSNESRLRSSLIKNKKQESTLTVEASKTNGSTIHFSYRIRDTIPALINIALIQPEATILVKRGENSGRKLHHVNIVRDLKTIETTSTAGSVDIEIPKDLRELPLKLIAYSQQKSNFKITGAAQTQLTAQRMEKHLSTP